MRPSRVLETSPSSSPSATRPSWGSAGVVPVGYFQDEDERGRARDHHDERGDVHGLEGSTAAFGNVSRRASEIMTTAPTVTPMTITTTITVAAVITVANFEVGRTVIWTTSPATVTNAEVELLDIGGSIG